MLPTIENSENFKKEYSSFKARTDAVTNERLKEELTGQITQLLREVRMIDEQHQNLFMTNQIPNMSADTKQKISELRQSISKRLDEWDRTIKQTQSS